MRIPRRPPTTPLHALGSRIDDIIGIVDSPTDEKGRYLHWDELHYRQPPVALTKEEWWAGLKVARMPGRRTIPLVDVNSKRFSFILPDPCASILHQTDMRMGGVIRMPEVITNAATKREYVVRSLIEEAITSSQIEGATTTRRIAKRMLRSGRSPIDKSERMIMNNYMTMQRLSELKDNPLSQEMVFEIHRSITDQTLDTPDAAGRFRKQDETIVVGDHFGNVVHAPPPTSTLPLRMDRLCAFANNTDGGKWIHPVVRSCLLHFWLAYDHPFLDGNGRTARALFYWSMLRHGYWLAEYISISRIIHQAATKYARAFLHTETDDNDLTYFLIYHLQLIDRAVRELHHYIARKTTEMRSTQSLLHNLTTLNHRQRVMVKAALDDDEIYFTITAHANNHGVSYYTARTDLNSLEKLGIFASTKSGRLLVYRPVQNIRDSIDRLDGRQERTA